MRPLTIRPLTHADVEAAAEVAIAALPYPPEFDTPDRPPWLRRRIAHFADHDGPGSWVSEEEGELTGVALAVLRDGIWGLSFSGVRPDVQARGTGRALLDATLRHGPAHAHIICSSVDPKAMRLYALAGLALRPCVAAAGVGDRSALPWGRPAREGIDVDRESV